MLQVDIPGQNMLLDEVIVHFDVLGPSVEDGVLGELDTIEVVTIDRCRIGNSTYRSFNICLNHMTSHIATTARYSAFVLDSTTVDCFSIHQVITTLPKENAYLDVDQQSPAFSARNRSGLVTGCQTMST